MKLSLVFPLLFILSWLTPELARAQEISPETIGKVVNIAGTSPVSKYSWKDRGKAPIGYIKGVAVTYAKSYAELKSGKESAVTLMSEKIGNPKNDGLAHYGLTANSNYDRLRSVFVLALGLGMRESSGNTTVGWDRSKLKLKPPIQPTEDNSEAGLFQVSWDSRRKSPWLLKLYDHYRADSSQCYLSIFEEGTTKHSESEVGTGDGLAFQKFNKACPAFATEYVLIMLRVDRSHFGPINRKRAEYNLDAEKMFRDIEAVVDSAN